MSGEKQDRGEMGRDRKRPGERKRFWGETKAVIQSLRKNRDETETERERQRSAETEVGRNRDREKREQGETEKIWKCARDSQRQEKKEGE